MQTEKIDFSFCHKLFDICHRHGHKLNLVALVQHFVEKAIYVFIGFCGGEFEVEVSPFLVFVKRLFVEINPLAELI